jgi:aminopeptidase-like protein
LANDNLSGIVVAAELAAALAARAQRRYSYRFLFIPATIGAITWLALNEAGTKRIKHGLVLSGIGDAGAITYKRSRQATAAIDRIVAFVLASNGVSHAIQDFSPYGYDERQFCSPGFNLPVGRFSRTPYGTYPEYHTSGDNPSFVKPESLAESLQILHKIVTVLEGNQLYVNTNPKCEPQLGNRGLYQELSSNGETMAMLWVLNLSDGGNTLLDIAERACMPFERIRGVAAILETHGLLSRLK